MEGYHWGVGGKEQGKKIQGIRSITGRHKIDWGGGVVKNSIGNGEAKDHLCTTHEMN